MGRARVEPDAFVPPKVRFTPAGRATIALHIDTGARHSHGKRVKSVWCLHYNHVKGAWRKCGELDRAMANPAFVNKLPAIIRLIEGHLKTGKMSHNRVSRYRTMVEGE